MWKLIKFLILGRPLKVCSHSYRFVDVQVYNDTSYCNPGLPSIHYTKVCEHCGDHQHGSIYGCAAKTPGDLNITQKER